MSFILFIYYTCFFDLKGMRFSTLLCSITAFGQCQVSSWVNLNYIPVCIVFFCSLLRRNRHCRTYLLGCKMESQLVLVSKDIYCE